MSRRRRPARAATSVTPHARIRRLRALSEADGLVMTEGTLYPLLGRLRKEGVVKTTWRESPSGPPRRYYRLTPTGRSLLGAFTPEWVRFRDSVDILLETGAPA